MSFGTALFVIDGGIAAVALPTIARSLKVGDSAAVLIVTVYQLVLVMALLPLSAVGERFGYRRVYQAGQLIFTVASLLCFFANSLPFLLALRGFQAFGAACAMSVASAMIRATYPSRQLGRGLAINSVIVSSAVAFAPTLGGMILAVAPWPWIFAVAVPFGIVSLLLGRALPEPEAGNRPFDTAGALLSAAFFGLVIVGIESAVHGDSPIVSAAIVLVGIAIGVAFVRRSLNDPHPILPVDLLARPVLALSMFGAFAAFVGQMTVILSLPFRLQAAYGFDPVQAGAMMAPWPLAMMLVTPLAGGLSDRYPAGVLGGIGMTLAATGLFALAWLPDAPGYWDVAWRMALSGAGFAMFMAPNARLIVGSAPIDRAAAAGGLIATNRLIGQTLGATLVAVLLASGVGLGSLPALIGAVLALVAGLCSVARLNPALRRITRHDADLG